MNYKLIIIIILIIFLLFLYKKNKEYKEKEYFNLTEVLQNMASVYEESDGTLSFQNLKAVGDTALKRVIVNSTFIVRDGLTNSGGGILNTGPGGITNTGGNITNRGKLINTGDIKITGKIDVDGDISGNLISLKGMIVMWSGTIGSIPTGWKLCDGQNGTPDLRSRFVIGAAGIGSVVDAPLTVKEFKPEGNKGGTETETLKIEQIPSHTHAHTAYYANFKHSGGAAEGSTRDDGDGSFGVTSTATGGGQAHNNMPPYYALAYIMKI